MVDKEPTRLVEPVTTPQHYALPSARELRAQSVHRLQVGLFGLCAMLLLVGLANIIMDRAERADVDDPIEDIIAVDEAPKKPTTDTLADIGVVPETDPDPVPTAKSEPAQKASRLPAK